MAASWLELGVIRVGQVDFEGSLAPLQKSLALYESLGLRRGVASASVKLSESHCFLSDYERAFEFAQRGLSLFEQEQNRGNGMLAAWRRWLKSTSNSTTTSRPCSVQRSAMAIAEEKGDRIRIAILRYELADEQLGLGNYDKALLIYKQILAESGRSGNPIGTVVRACWDRRRLF